MGAPRLLGVATTDAGGYFAMQIKPGSPNSKGIFYATADLGRGVQLVSIIGPELADFVTINELTTLIYSNVVSDLEQPPQTYTWTILTTTWRRAM